jgi:hypothetical protein
VGRGGGGPKGKGKAFPQDKGDGSCRGLADAKQAMLQEGSLTGITGAWTHRLILNTPKPDISPQEPILLLRDKRHTYVACL